MNRNSFELQILINGRPVKEYNHNNETYIEGRKGTEYTLKVKNNTYQRVLAVPAVDGINVITGKPATPDDSGYIIDGYNCVEIKVFRKDLNTVGAFKFTSKGKSYAASKGIGYNTGVIGVVIFNEKMSTLWINCNYTDNSFKPWNLPPDPHITYTTNDSAGVNYSKDMSENTLSIDNQMKCSCNYSHSSRSIIQPQSVQNASPSFNLGTTWGEAKSDNVTLSEFERGSELERLVIYYSDVQGLINMGVNVKQEKLVYKPVAFFGFAQPPAGWKG